MSILSSILSIFLWFQAVSERQSSLTKQVKKGLSNIVKKSSSSKATATSSNTSAEVNAKKLKLALAQNLKSKNKKKTLDDITDSLPSSQEEKIQISPDPELESEYESAEE